MFGERVQRQLDVAFVHGHRHLQTLGDVQERIQGRNIRIVEHRQMAALHRRLFIARDLGQLHPVDTEPLCLDTRVGTIDVAVPKLRTGTYFPEWLLQRRKRAETALIAAAVGPPR